MSSLIEANILATCNCAGFSEGEDDQTYLARLVNEINKLDDNGWAGLSAEAQSWSNEAVASITNKTAIADFPDFVEDVAPAPVAPPPPPPAPRTRTPVAAPVAPAPVARGRTPVAAPVAPAAPVSRRAAPAAAAPVAAPVEAPEGEKKVGGTTRLRQLLIETQVGGQLTIAQKDAAKLLADEGYAISSQTTGAIFYELRHSLKLLAEYGMLAK